MCVMIFSTNFVWNISHSMNRARCDQKYILVSLYSTFYWSPCTVPFIGLPVRTFYWSPCTVPFIGLPVQYLLLVSLYSTFYCPPVQYLLLVPLYSTFYWSPCTVPFIGLPVQYIYSCLILMKLAFFDRVSKNPQIWNFLKICPVGDGLFHADGLTDMKLIGYFEILHKAPENVLEPRISCAHWHSKYNWLNLKLHS